MTGVAKGPAVGTAAGPVGYQPTVEPSSGSGTNATWAGVPGAGAGWSGGVGAGTGWTADGDGDGDGDGTPKLGGIIPGLA